LVKSAAIYLQAWLHHKTRSNQDALAIAEYANKHFTRGSLRPDDALSRAHERCMAAEMHAGFEHLPRQMPMNRRATGRSVTVNNSLKGDI
jgi:glutathione S-transferase|tara:strand:- start:839 stop:1108 length:270 start_codon:yes stop_codon:yes gene_type:complete